MKLLEDLKTEESEEESKSVEEIFPKGIRTNEIKNELDKIKKWEEKIRRKDLVKYYFQQYKTVRSFGEYNKYL